jgi:hypothetical protein
LRRSTDAGRFRIEIKKPFSHDRHRNITRNLAATPTLQGAAGFDALRAATEKNFAPPTNWQQYAGERTAWEWKRPEFARPVTLARG